MKKLFLVLLTLLAINAFSQQQINSKGELEPLGAYPVTSVKHIKGAQRTVPTLAARDSIPTYLRDTGMLVYVLAIDTAYYMLKGGLDNSNWVEFPIGGNGTSISGGANARTIIDTVFTTGNALIIALYSGGGRVINATTIGENGSGFIPTYVTGGDSTFIFYPAAPNGQVVYKLSVVNPTDTLSGGGNEIVDNGGGGGSATVDYASVINALGYVPVESPFDSTDIVNALGFVPTHDTLNAADLIAALGYTPAASPVNYLTDIINKPTIPAQFNLIAGAGVRITGSYPSITALMDTNYLNNYLAAHTYTGIIINTCNIFNTRYGIISERDAGETLQQYQLSQRTADSLGIPIIRTGLISTSGSLTGLYTLLNSNRQTSINIRNTPEDGTRNFTTAAERPAYVNFLDTFFRNTLSTYHGDTLICAANEEANKGYHTLDTSNNLALQSAYLYYQNELKPLDSIAKLYGPHFKTTNGGTTGETSWWFVWKNLTDSGRTADAAELAKAVFPAGANPANYPTGSNYGITIKMTQQLIPYIRSSNITYWNWHVKVITNGTDSAHINPNIIKWGAEAWTNLTGKPVITNEAATTSMNPNNTAELAIYCSRVMDYVLFYDGTSRTSTPTWSGGDVSYRNLGNTINNIGVNLRNVLQAIKR